VLVHCTAQVAGWPAAAVLSKFWPSASRMFAVPGPSLPTMDSIIVVLVWKYDVQAGTADSPETDSPGTTDR